MNNNKKKEVVKKRAAKSNQSERSPNPKVEESFNQGLDPVAYPRMSMIQASKRENPEYEEVNKAVHEYLLKLNFRETLERFKYESIKKYHDPPIDVINLPGKLLEVDCIKNLFFFSTTLLIFLLNHMFLY